MPFTQNQELAFAVVQSRNTGNGVPKVTKIVGELYTDPEHAIMARNAMNHDFDETGQQTPYSAVSMQVSFVSELGEEELALEGLGKLVVTDIRKALSPALGDKAENSESNVDEKAYNGEEFIERISEMDAFDLLDLLLEEADLRTNEHAIQAIRQRNEVLAHDC